MNFKRINALYQHLLHAAGWTADEDGYVSIQQPNGDLEPCLIGEAEQRLVLPIEKQFDKLDQSKIVFFHVLHESVSKGESEVFRAWRLAVAERLQTTALVVITALLTLGGTSKKHGKLTPVQSEVLQIVADMTVDPKTNESRTLNDWLSLVEAIDHQPKARAFVSLYVKAGGVLDNKTHQRVAVATFPFYKQLVMDGEERTKKMEERAKLDKEKRKDLPAIKNETFGVDLRVADRAMYLKLIEYILPNIQDAMDTSKMTWASFSNSNDGTSADAMMKTVQKIANPLNAVIDKFVSIVPNLEEVRYPMDWVEEFRDIDDLGTEIRKIVVGKKDKSSSGSEPRYADRREGSRDDDTRTYRRDDAGHDEPAARKGNLSFSDFDSRSSFIDRDDYRRHDRRDSRDNRDVRRYRDRDERDDRRSRNGHVSAGDVMDGMFDDYYHNDRTSVFQTPDRDRRDRRDYRGRGRRGY